jgi:hypothetical protein
MPKKGRVWLGRKGPKHVNLGLDYQFLIYIIQALPPMRPRAKGYLNLPPSG